MEPPALVRVPALVLVRPPAPAPGRRRREVKIVGPEVEILVGVDRHRRGRRGIGLPRGIGFGDGRCRGPVRRLAPVARRAGNRLRAQPRFREGGIRLGQLELLGRGLVLVRLFGGGPAPAEPSAAPLAVRHIDGILAGRRTLRLSLGRIAGCFGLVSDVGRTLSRLFVGGGFVGDGRLVGQRGVRLVDGRLVRLRGRPLRLRLRLAPRRRPAPRSVPVQLRPEGRGRTTTGRHGEPAARAAPVPAGTSPDPTSGLRTGPGRLPRRRSHGYRSPSTPGPAPSLDPSESAPAASIRAARSRSTVSGFDGVGGEGGSCSSSS